MNVIELFAGAGGLALGVKKAGFTPLAIIERDRHACVTLRHNFSAELGTRADDLIIEGDVRRFPREPLTREVDLVSGGPPCQPFSIGGKHRGHADSRDMFPEAARVVREARPRAFIFENVRGLMRRSFARYFGYIELQLTYPEIAPRDGEAWESHLARLEAHHTQGGAQRGLHYRVVPRLVNAADHGVPQRRQRVVIVGFRSDVRANWSFPLATHSEDALLRDQWVTGDYWERHRVAKRQRPAPPADLARRRDKLGQAEGRPWRTTREALAGLPEPGEEGLPLFSNHRFQPGARAYAGHTGSPLDGPAKTLKAGDHGVPGGENMLATADGKVRYFTVRESARLQTFPDNFLFPGSWTENMRQIGNAVPVDLAELVARSVRTALDNSEQELGWGG